jgi:hypothetical protein
LLLVVQTVLLRVFGTVHATFYFLPVVDLVCLLFNWNILFA